DALGAGALSALQTLAHRATERHTSRELLGDALRDELSVGLGVLDLEDVQLDLLAGELLEVGADALGLGAAAADDDARAGGVDVVADAVTPALDLDAADAGAVELRLQQTTDLDVLGDVVGVTLARLRRVGEPTRDVVRGDAEAEAVGVYLLSHYLLAFLLLSVVEASAAAATSGVESTTVMWLVRFLIWKARPCARGWKRLSVVPSSTYALTTYRSAASRYSPSRSALTCALAMADATSL